MKYIALKWCLLCRWGRGCGVSAWMGVTCGVVVFAFASLPFGGCEFEIRRTLHSHHSTSLSACTKESHAFPLLNLFHCGLLLV